MRRGTLSQSVICCTSAGRLPAEQFAVNSQCATHRHTAKNGGQATVSALNEFRALR